MKPNKIDTPVTPELFESEVEAFKVKHNITIDQLLEDSIGRNTVLIEEFFSNPAIYAYLSRSVDKINFFDKRPNDNCLTESEIKIYKCRPDLFPFRKKVANDKFYLIGANVYESQYFYRPLIDKYPEANVSIAMAQDIYQIRDFLDKQLSNNQIPLKPFILTPNWKDEHATLLFHIVDVESRRIMASLFINSRNDEDYLEYMSERFNHRFNSFATKEAIRHGDIKFCYLPMTDASLMIQKLDDDQNCTLYAYNFMEAIIKMLAKPDIAEKILLSAKSIIKEPNNKTQDFQIMFTDMLKDHLPCYYKNKILKPQEELKTFHLKQRWEIGCDILSSLYHPKVRLYKSIFSDMDKTPSLTNVSDNKITRFVADNVLSILYNEKLRLLNKYSVIENKITSSPQLSMNDVRIQVLDELISQICRELVNFEENPHSSKERLKKRIVGIISSHLKSNLLDKYKSWQEKLHLSLLNILLSLPLVGLPIKKLITGSWFFSLVGKTVESCETALQNIDNNF